jgi:hypothetical protein
MHAEKELQRCQQKDQSNIDENLNQVLAKVEQVFAKVEIAISRRVAASAATAASSPPPPPPTSTQESGKNLIHAEIVQFDRESAPTEKKKFDIKSKNH